MEKHMKCDNCDKKIVLGTRWWIHKKTNDSWCNPLQSQFSWNYPTAIPKVKHRVDA